MSLNLPRCETCNIDLHGRDVLFDGVDSRCRQCNNAVLLDDARHKRNRRRKTKGTPGVPEGVTIKRSTDKDGTETLLVKVPWSMQRPDDGFNLTGWILVAAVILGALEFGASKPLSFLLGGALLGLFALLRQVNQTSILVRPTAIRVFHSPLPWRSRVFDPRTMEQLYVARRPIAQHVFDYGVRARLDDDLDVSFFRGLREPAVAFYLEQCIEQYFDIEDRSVRGEYTEPPPEEPQSPYLD